MGLGRIFDQEQRPAFTLVSFVTTMIVPAALVAVNTAHYRDWGAIVKLPLTYGLLILGVFTNLFAAVMAHAREEHWGARIGFTGAALCTVTWLVLHQRGVAP